MLSLDPDDFLAGVAEDRDYPTLPFPATEKLVDEEELEWLSNKDAFPAAETCMLSEETPYPIANTRQQNRRVSVSVAEAGIGKILLPPMPSRKSKKDGAKVKNKIVCTYCGFAQTPPWPEEPLPQHILCNACGYSYKPGQLCPEDSAKVKRIKRACTHCGITQTPQWRHGPLGRRTLCNACGVRYKSGRLCPEYRPANSPTFSNKLHSNAHRKVMEIRKQKYGTVSKRVNKCVATSALTKSKKYLFPPVTTVNILDQPSRSVIVEEQSSVSVLENSSNSSTIFLSFSGTLKSPHQPPSKFLRRQMLFCNQPDNHNQEYTTKVEIEGNSTTLMSFCGTLEQPPQSPSKFLDQWQLFYNQPNMKRNNKNTAKVEMVVKPVDKCTTTLMKSKKDSFPAVEILSILEQSSGIVIAKQQSPVLVLENSTNRSATLISSCGTIELPHQTSRKFMGEQQLFCNQDNNNLSKKDTANVEIEGNSPTAMRSCGMLESPHQAPSEFLGQQQLFCNQPNNKSNKKDTDKVGIEGKCQNCGTEQSPRWWEGPLRPKSLCLSCGLAKYTARRQRSISLASNKKCNKKDTVKAEMAVKPMDKCTNSTTTLMHEVEERPVLSY